MVQAASGDSGARVTMPCESRDTVEAAAGSLSPFQGLIHFSAVFPGPLHPWLFSIAPSGALDRLALRSAARRNAVFHWIAGMSGFEPVRAEPRQTAINSTCECTPIAR